MRTRCDVQFSTPKEEILNLQKTHHTHTVFQLAPAYVCLLVLACR